jgi:DNA-binding IclR family transcriptional regulator
MTNETSTESGRSGVQVITRTATILDILGNAPQGMSLGGIAGASGLPRSTVQRLVTSLESVGLVATRGSGGITLGPAFLRLVSGFHTDTVTAIRPALEALSEQTGETVSLSRPVGRDLSIIHCVVASGELQIVPRLGLRRLLYSTSAGRALLSLQPDAAVEALFREEFSPEPGFSIQSIPQLLASLERIRYEGISYDYGEMIEGVNTMAVGMQTLPGHFSVSMLIPQGRFDRKHDFCVACLNGVRETLLQRLGAA